jgi:UDP-N-acetylglucosamine--N-acetylmuramyl-(pentapeptide) pyrophosphoryl-undecaprenol N-acetylglucosamine transferase
MNRKVIISGGGTGGHIFPAISIANELKRRDSRMEILFVGASDRMEMEKVPAAGYDIVGLPVSGFSRANLLRNIPVLWKLMISMRKARSIIIKFNPDVVVGVGGYASGPLLKSATRLEIPAVIQEQNSYAGLTNRLLAKRVNTICVAYDGMEKYFPKEKIILTGNPVREDIENIKSEKSEGYEYFKLEKSKKVLLILGGSLGAGTINNSLLKEIAKLMNSDFQVIWQTGKYYFDNVKTETDKLNVNNIKVHSFITRMDLAYLVADVIISRAGAGTISEICLVSKPVILVPSPNVAEDHQTINALSLAKVNAAIVIRDDEAAVKLVDEALILLKDTEKCKTLSDNIKKMALRNSVGHIVDEIWKWFPNN